MTDLTIQILSGLGLLVLGVVMGATLGRSFHGESKKNKRLEQKVSELENEQMRYKAEVSAHFMKTAELVNTMNQSYREVHAQLAKGAATLCGDDHSEDFLKISFLNAQKEAPKEEAIQSQPPMDYAPKPEGDEGTLSEGYGLNHPEEETAEESKEEAQSK